MLRNICVIGEFPVNSSLELHQFEVVCTAVSRIPFGRTPSILGVNSVHEGSVLTVGFGLLKFQKRAHDREMLEQFLSSTTQVLPNW